MTATCGEAHRVDARQTPKWWLGFGLIFLTALIVRVAIVRHFAMRPCNDLCWNDAVGWNLANGRGFTASQEAPYIPGVFRTPAYPAFLAAVYGLCGHSYTAAYLVQAVLDAASAVIISLIALRLLSPRIAAFTGALYALYPYSAIHCGLLSQDILLTFTVVVTLFLITRTGLDVKRPGRWLVVGLMLGVVALVKAFMVFYAIVPALVVLSAAAPVRRKTAALAMLALGLAIVIGPWMVRNYLTFHSFPPLAAGGVGSDMMLLVTELDQGERGLIRLIKPLRNGGENRAEFFRKLSDGATLIAEERALARKAAAQIARRWPRYLLLILRHIPRLWLTNHTVGQSRIVFVAARLISWCLLVPGLLGMYLLRRQWHILLPLYATIIVITLTYSPYLVEARYTLPARPALILFAAAALSIALEWLQQIRRSAQTHLVVTARDRQRRRRHAV